MKARRRPCLDEYVEGGESAVLIGDQVFVLSELATSILGAVGDRSVEVSEVAAVLGAEFGAPPGGDLVEATHLALQELASQGLLEYPV